MATVEAASATVGPPIQATEGMPRLSIAADSGHLHGPVAAYDRWIVLQTEPFPITPNDENVPRQYSLWDPETGETASGWSAPPGWHDGVFDADGDWIATVRVGFSLPFPEWSLILRNLKTGEEREIAKSDPRVLEVPGLHPQLPSGFAPWPSLSGGKLVWAEYTVDTPGQAKKKIQLYDVAKGTRQTLYEVSDPTVEDVRVPVIRGGKVAWIRSPNGSGEDEIVVRDLESGTEETHRVGGYLYTCALSDDARYLMWDDGYYAKYARDLTTGETVKYATDQGWGTYQSGHYVSWIPGAAYGGYGGFYDLEKRVVRFLPMREDVDTNIAQVMGSWFVWQERVSIPPDLPPDEEIVYYEKSYYYFMKLEP